MRLQNYLKNFEHCLLHENFLAIKNYLSFNCSLDWLVKSDDEDEVVRLEQMFEFASFIAKKQACERIEINPLRILINNTNHLLKIYKSNLEVSKFRGIKNLFRVMKTYDGKLSAYSFSLESQMGDLDILWHSYTGYHWNGETCSVIACTHDKSNILDLIRWRDCFIYTLNMMGSVRHIPGGKIVIFFNNDHIPQEHYVAKVKL